MTLAHYNDVVMNAMTSQITSLTIVCSTVYSGADRREHQSSESLAFVRGIHQWPVNSPHKWPVTRKIWWRHHEHDGHLQKCCVEFPETHDSMLKRPNRNYQNTTTSLSFALAVRLQNMSYSSITWNIFLHRIFDKYSLNHKCQIKIKMHCLEASAFFSVSANHVM